MMIKKEHGKNLPINLKVDELTTKVDQKQNIMYAYECHSGKVY